jgi:hypothetical protein
MYCSFDGCENKKISRKITLCSGHHSQQRAGKALKVLRKTQSTKNLLCLVQKCTGEVVSKNYCQKHYDQVRQKGYTYEIEPKQKHCLGPNCDRSPVAKGLCNSHWAQQKRQGKLTPIVTEETIEERFNRSIRKDADGCWIWLAAGSGKFYDKENGSGGYGQIRHSGKSYMAHRWSYEHFKKTKLHPEDTLDHLCRATRCCNPDHLEIVSRTENIKRMQLYHQLRSENERMRKFIAQLGYDPQVVLQGGDPYPDLPSL